MALQYPGEYNTGGSTDCWNPEVERCGGVTPQELRPSSVEGCSHPTVTAREGDGKSVP